MHGHGMRKKKNKPKPTLAELNKMAFLKIRKARKPPPFLSSLDRGVNRKMLRAMWEEEIINDFDYETELRRVDTEKRTSAAMTDRELKDFLRENDAWYPGQAREEMEYLYTYWKKRGTQMLRLKERCEMGSFGGPMEEIHKIRDEQITKVEKFQRADYRNARACFLSLVDLESVWLEIPKMVLDQCLLVFDAKKEWVFYEKSTKASVHKNQRRYDFPEEFKEFLRTKNEQGMLFWFRPVCKFSKMSAFFERHEDTSTGERYGPLQLKEFWWHKSWGGMQKPPRFTKSATKVVTNYKSGSFDFNSVAELVYQSNENIEPIGKYTDAHRQDYEFLAAQNLLRRDLKLKYTTKTDKAIEKLVKKRCKREMFGQADYAPWRGMPTASPVKRKKKRDLDAEDDALLEQAEREMEEERARKKAEAIAKKKADEEAAKEKKEEEEAAAEKAAAEKAAEEEEEKRLQQEYEDSKKLGGGKKKRGGKKTKPPRKQNAKKETNVGNEAQKTEGGGGQGKGKQTKNKNKTKKVQK